MENTLDFFTQEDTLHLVNYIKKHQNKNKPLMLFVDLFCGAGGVTEGFSRKKNTFIIACVNHDPDAIRSHHANHPYCIHYAEDIKDWHVVVKINELINILRVHFPNAIFGLHASLECTHFSKAKGGLSRNADSRTLGYDLEQYLISNYDYVTIENVEEFLTWGPLDKEGQPIKEKYSEDYNKWVKMFESHGFKYDYKILNAADFGAHTSRKRYFGIFAYNNYPIVFPEPTHITKKKAKKHPELKIHKAVKDVLNLDIEGLSIFGLNKNNKEYSLKTIARVYFGLIKFWKEGYFIVRYNGGDPKHKSNSIYEPLGTIMTANRHSIVEPLFLSSYYGNSKNGQGIYSLNNPSGTITTKDRFALHHLQYAYGKAVYSSIEKPLGSITTVPKAELITTKWLFDTQFGRIGNSINKVSPTIIARQDKKPMYLASATIEDTNNDIVDYSIWNENDSFIVMLLKTFMREHSITDIKIRSLFVDELSKIQGFPETYIFKGGETKAKKYIGNSVAPIMAEALCNSIYDGIEEYLKTT